MYRRVSILLAVVLVAGVLVAFTPGDDPGAKATLGPLQAVTLAGADFHPVSDVVPFGNGGYRVGFAGGMVARIPFPAETVVLTSVKARVYDNHANDLCVDLYRARPGDATGDYWGSACSSGQSTTDPQTLSITAFARVGKFHTAYLRADSGANSSNLGLYGATVFYRIVT